MENAEVGYSLLYPGDWQVKGKIVATEFAEEANCESVEVIDFQPPPGSPAFILHSLAQICAKAYSDGATLEEFMRRTYGDTFLTQFRGAILNGVPVYQAENTIADKTLFLQTKKHRLQIVTAVVADPNKRSERSAQVEEILAGFSLERA